MCYAVSLSAGIQRGKGGGGIWSARLPYRCDVYWGGLYDKSCTHRPKANALKGIFVRYSHCCTAAKVTIIWEFCQCFWGRSMKTENTGIWSCRESRAHALCSFKLFLDKELRLIGEFYARPRRFRHREQVVVLSFFFT